MSISPLQQARYQYKPKVPAALAESIDELGAVQSGEPIGTDFPAEIREHFPHTLGRSILRFRIGEGRSPKRNPFRVAVILSGGQAPGGHNVIAGLFDGLKKVHPESQLFGFQNGPGGILDDDCIELTGELIDRYRNTGGFDIIGSGRTKLESEDQFKRTTDVFRKRNLDALVVVGGDDSNTNAALLAEYMEREKTGIQVIGVPKTIDGDLKSEHVEASFGFDTASKSYAELIGNIARDAASARKYWHFIKLMGRSASHIALECALQTQPNICIISEEVAEKGQQLEEVVYQIVTTIVRRSKRGDNFGVVLVPEGLIEAIPEINALISEINVLLAENEHYFTTLKTFEDQAEWVNKKLNRDLSYLFSTLPNEIQRQLLMDRDPHGNVQVSRIDTERLLVDMVETRLNEMKSRGDFQGKFSHQDHFFGYEGRAAFPSNFDADYCQTLGMTAGLLIACGANGYISAVRGLARPSSQWESGGIPLVGMMTMEKRKGKMKPVIEKALVKTSGKPFTTFEAQREHWAVETAYRYPGAIQYFGPAEIADQPSLTLQLEHQS